MQKLGAQLLRKIQVEVIRDEAFSFIKEFF
jgi:hypothetical protein